MNFDVSESFISLLTITRKITIKNSVANIVTVLFFKVFTGHLHVKLTWIFHTNWISHCKEQMNESIMLLSRISGYRAGTFSFSSRSSIINSVMAKDRYSVCSLAVQRIISLSNLHRKVTNIKLGLESMFIPLLMSKANPLFHFQQRVQLTTWLQHPVHWCRFHFPSVDLWLVTMASFGCSSLCKNCGIIIHWQSNHLECVSGQVTPVYSVSLWSSNMVAPQSYGYRVLMSMVTARPIGRNVTFSVALLSFSYMYCLS